MGIATNFMLLHQRVAQARLIARESGVSIDLPDEAGVQAAIDRSYDFKHKRVRTPEEILGLSPKMTATLATQVSQPQQTAGDVAPTKKKRASK